MLALNSGQPTSRADIVEALWRDQPPPSASNVIQTYIRTLRRLLEPGRQAYGHSSYLPRIGDGYALRVPDLDVLRFKQLLASRHDAEALRLWHGTPLADVPALAGHKKVLALIEQRRAALARYGDLRITAGAAHEVVTLLEDAAADQPLDEAALARLIRAYQAVGRRAQAFRTYHTARRKLAEELGVDPGSRTGGRVRRTGDARQTCPGATTGGRRRLHRPGSGTVRTGQSTGRSRPHRSAVRHLG
ncbi:AfsR/SARP family transcriptional regulator [Kibdelosporangium aridum]|uniref:AfsR/SARP family transcriptional regulator n=1 Tax=Kibdelosporangium aridum TaxID=2030 RepID=UPI0035E56E54